LKVIGIQSSPNPGGLRRGEGAETELIHLNRLDVGSCKAHDRGWGTCRREGKRMIEDDFQELREKINQADALVFSTPVYFGDLSESA
jgi:multimeric flavodoxin WrbA